MRGVGLLNSTARACIGRGHPQRQHGRKSRRALECAAACASANYFFAGAEVGAGRGEDVVVVVVPDLLLLRLMLEVFICA
jgi:hypothetical protein